MQALKLPHEYPIRFAQSILFQEETKARVSIEFEEIPTLGMMVESAAQSSAAFSKTESKNGFLVSLKNIKLLQKPREMSLEVALINEYALGDMNYFSFQVYEGEVAVLTGGLVIAVG